MNFNLIGAIYRNSKSMYGYIILHYFLFIKQKHGCLLYEVQKRASYLWGQDAELCSER